MNESNTPTAPSQHEPRRPWFLRASEEVNTTRSMTLYALGALLGLGIAGYGLFTAAGTSTHAVPPEDIALVNRRPILRSDFIAQLESETGLKFDESSQADRVKVLDEMVREELLVQRALELDFAETDQATRNALVTTISQQATVEVTTSQPSEGQLQEFYERHKDRYASEGTMQVRHWLLPLDPAKPRDDQLKRAREAAQAVRAGEPVAGIMRRFGLSEGEGHDEDYYFAVKYRLGDMLFAAVEELPSGAVSEPIADKAAIHIVQVLKNTRPVPLGYEASRPRVFTDFKEAAQMRLLEATMAFLRSRATILIAKDYAGIYKP
jgi:parvulin-like peptidyl-prolyl isomerase